MYIIKEKKKKKKELKVNLSVVQQETQASPHTVLTFVTNPSHLFNFYTMIRDVQNQEIFLGWANINAFKKL